MKESLNGEKEEKKVSSGFLLFLKETNGVGEAFFAAIEKLSKESALEDKTQELAYISCLTALHMQDGLPFHMQRAKDLKATKEEVRSAVLVPLPLIGIRVMDALEILEDIFSE